MLEQGSLAMAREGGFEVGAAKLEELGGQGFRMLGHDLDPVKVWDKGWGCLKSQPPTFLFQPLKSSLSLIKSAFPGWKWGEDRLRAPVAPRESSTVQHRHPGGDGLRFGPWIIFFNPNSGQQNKTWWIGKMRVSESLGRKRWKSPGKKKYRYIYIYIYILYV